MQVAECRSNHKAGFCGYFCTLRLASCSLNSFLPVPVPNGGDNAHQHAQADDPQAES